MAVPARPPPQRRHRVRRGHRRPGRRRLHAGHREGHRRRRHRHPDAPARGRGWRCCSLAGVVLVRAVVRPPLGRRPGEPRRAVRPAQRHLRAAPAARLRQPRRAADRPARVARVVRRRRCSRGCCRSCRSCSATRDARAVARRDVVPVAAAHARDARDRCRCCSSCRCACARTIFPATWDAQQRAGEVAGVVDEAVTGVRVVKGFGQEDRELDHLADARRRPVRARGSGSCACRPGSRRRCRRSRRSAQVAVLALGGWLAHQRPHHARHVPRLLRRTSCSSSRRCGMLAGAARRRPAGPGRRRAHPRPARRQPARAGRARRRRPARGPRRGALRATCASATRATEPVLDGFDLHVAPGRGRSRSSAPAARASRRSTAAAAPLLRRRRGPRHDRRRRRARRHARLAAPPGRRGVRGRASSSPTRSRANIAYGRPDATDAEVEAAARAAEAARVHPRAARRLRHRRRRAGPHAVGRPAPARSPSPAPLLTDPRILVLDDATSSVDAATEEEIHATLRTHRWPAAPRSSSPTGARRCGSPTASSWSTTAASSTPGTHEELLARAATLYRALLAGPGRRRRRRSTSTDRGVDAAQVDGITPSAWRGLDADDVRSAQIADAPRPRARRPRCGSPAAVAAPAAAAAAWAWRARADARAARRRSTRSPRPTTTPTSTSTAESRADAPTSGSSRFVRAGPRLAGARPRARRRSTRVLHAARPAPRPPRHRPRRRRRQRRRALWVASRAVPRRRARRLGRRRGATRSSPAAPPSGCCYALRVKIFAHLQRLVARLLRPRDGRPDHDPHDDRHRRARRSCSRPGSSTRSSASLTCVGVFVFLVVLVAAARARRRRRPAAAVRRHVLVPARARRVAYDRARERDRRR